jgi:hypothetical protein
MLDWVVETLHAAESVSRITVIGADELSELFSRRYIDRRVEPARSVLESVSGLFRNGPEENGGFLVIPCEAVFVSPGAIDAAVKKFLGSGGDIGIPLVPKRLMPRGSNYPPPLMWRGKMMIPGAFALARKASRVIAAVQALRERSGERDPLQGPGVIFPALTSAQGGVLQRASEIRYFELGSPGAALTVRFVKDMRFARSALAYPWRPRFRKIKIIANPHSGQGAQLPAFLKKILGIRKRSLDPSASGAAFTESIKKYLNEFGMYPEVSEAGSSSDATEQARRCAAKGYDLVIAAGGMARSTRW